MRPLPKFADLLLLHLQASGLTKSELADKSGISKQLLSGILNATRTPPLEKIPLMAAALSLTADESNDLAVFAGISHIPDKTAQELVLHALFTRQTREKAVGTKSPIVTAFEAKCAANQQLTREVTDLKSKLETIHRIIKPE